MKYKIVFYKYDGDDFYSVEVMLSNEFISFPAKVGNPNYDAFLTQAELTDKQVHALKPDAWYDFPE